MGAITYEQFVALCEYWDYTVDEGFRAMCFNVSVVGRHLENCHDYAKETENSNHTDAFKSFVSTILNDAILLSTLYNNLENEVFNMLEKHDSEV